jgi:hypothetical protein
MPREFPVLVLRGDAEASLMADAGTYLGAALPHLGFAVTSAWATRPDLLAPDAPPPPRSLRERGIIPDVDVRALLDRPHRLVVLPFFPGVAAPLFQHRDGGAFLAHRKLRANWTPEQAEVVAAECTAAPPLPVSEAAEALAVVVERLHAAGTAVALCTAFRHVNEPLDDRPRRTTPSTRDLVRASNLAVARLSARTGCFVLDVDRVLAEEGGALLAADCFGGHGRAAEIALDELLSLFFDALPDDAMSQVST